MKQELGTDRRLRQEVGEFLKKFSWEQTLKSAPKDLKIADVGARNFFLAPELESLFESLGFSPIIHGIEVDAYRRYADIRLRAQYGHFYAGKVKRGRFHAMDFCDFHSPLDVVILLNPFVFEGSVLAWGLPRRFLWPSRLYEHARSLLKSPHGLLLLSAPTEEEFEENTRWAYGSGFILLEQQQSIPGAGSLQLQ